MVAIHGTRGEIIGMSLLKPATLPRVIVDVVKVVYIDLKRPATLTQVITEVVDVGQVWPSTLPLVIAENMLIEVDLGHKIPSTIPLKIREQMLMLKGEVDIGLRPATIPPIIKVKVLYC